MFLLSLVAPIFQPAAARESGHNGLRNADNVNTSQGERGEEEEGGVVVTASRERNGRAKYRQTGCVTSA